MADEVRSSLAAGILSLSIHRPEQRNALDHAVLKGLREAIQQAGWDKGVRAVTLSGAGDKVFCSGADLKLAVSDDRAAVAFHQGDFHRLLVEILRCPKPTVALARGHVLAGGMGILLACDLALACDDVYFSTPEIHVGMYPMMVLALLYRHVGRKKATEMLFLGERVPAAAALELGIVNHVFPRASFDREAGGFVEKLTQKSASILRSGKDALWRVEGRKLQEDLDFLEQALGKVMSCADSKEGMRAFLEKRPPVWKDE